MKDQFDHKCLEVSEDEILLLAYEESDARVKKHVDGCEACSEYLAMLREIKSQADGAGFLRAGDEVVSVLKKEAGERVSKRRKSRGVWRRVLEWLNSPGDEAFLPARVWAPALVVAMLAIGTTLYWTAFKAPGPGKVAEHKPAPEYLAGVSEKLLELESLFDQEAQDANSASDEAYDEADDEDDDFDLNTGLWELVMEEESEEIDIDLAMAELEYGMGLSEEDESEQWDLLFDTNGY